MVTGYSECIDSLFAFGLFATARRSGFFPSELVDTFEPVINEEARHILVFVNWAAWRSRTMPFWRRPWFEFKVLAVWLFPIWERIGIARDVAAGRYLARGKRASHECPRSPLVTAVRGAGLGEIGALIHAMELKAKGSRLESA